MKTSLFVTLYTHSKIVFMWISQQDDNQLEARLKPSEPDGMLNFECIWQRLSVRISCLTNSSI